MKKYITYIFIFITLNSFSQVNFFQTGATWGYYSLEHPDTPWDPYRTWLEQSDLTGDTTINNINYKKLHRHIKETQMPGSHSGNPFVVFYDHNFEYLRFDSLTMRVYYVNDIDTIEQLIYDFNLSIGDTVPNSSNPFYIDSIENITLFGFPVRKFYLVSDTTMGGSINPDQYIIEGIGGSNGLTTIQPHDVLSVSSHIVTDILCFQLGNNIYPNGSACDVFSGINETEKDFSEISIIPNPFRNSFRVNIPSNEKNLLLKIFDITGRQVYSKSLTGKSEINDFTLTGFYNWEIIRDQKIIGKGKLLHLKD